MNHSFARRIQPAPFLSDGAGDVGPTGRLPPTGAGYIKAGPERAKRYLGRSLTFFSDPLLFPSCPLMADSCEIFLLGLMFFVAFSVTGVSGAKFDEVIQASWASDHMTYDGELLKLKLDNFSGTWGFNACFFDFYCFLLPSLILSGSESLCFALHGLIFSITQNYFRLSLFCFNSYIF